MSDPRLAAGRIQVRKRWSSSPSPSSHRDAVSYPLALRTTTYEPWKPIIGIFVVLIGGFAAAPVVLIPVLAVVVGLQGGDGSFGHRLQEALNGSPATPASMLYLNLSLAALALVAIIVLRRVHGLPLSWLFSVMPGVRWRFFWVCAGFACFALLAAMAVSALLPRDPVAVGGTARFPTGQLLATTVVILLTTPLQALGEECAFRGYLMQAFGSLSRSRIVGLIGTATLFALAHGLQNAPLFLDRFAFGLMAGGVVILTGGLEAGIALHVLNNLGAFGLAIAFGRLDAELGVTSATWWQIPVTLTENGVFLVLVLIAARRMGISNVTTPATSPREE